MTETEARRKIRDFGGGIVALPSGELVFTQFRKIRPTSGPEGAAVWVGSFFPAGRSWVQPLGTVGCYGTAVPTSHTACPDLETAVRLAVQAMFDLAGPAPPIVMADIPKAPLPTKSGNPRTAMPPPARVIRNPGGLGG